MVRHGNKPGPRPCAGREWQRLQRIIYTTHEVCWICGKYVDQRLTRGSLMRSVDHAIPQALAPQLAMELSNLRLAHLGCNSARGKRIDPRPRAVASRAW
jgi:5-methylcytosine-specific restriction endonuclease McrA